MGRLIDRQRQAAARQARAERARRIWSEAIRSFATLPFADPRGGLAVNIQDPDFAPFRIDLAAELEHVALSALFSARRERRGKGPRKKS